MFTLDATAIGIEGVCRDQPFAVSPPDPTGMVVFTPARPLVLQSFGPASVCTIRFDFDVQRLPTVDTSQLPRVQTAAAAVVRGTARQPGVTLVVWGSTTQLVTVERVVTSLVTQASGPVEVGGQISDTATLSGGLNPTGTITFRLFGPDDADCGNSVAFTSSGVVTGNGVYLSAAFNPNEPGTYRWVASYSGDATNAPANNACNDPGESVTVTPPPTTSTTTTSTLPPTTTSTSTTTSTLPPTTTSTATTTSTLP
ncbi:MAG TPA: Ig-like domain-containing protein, partial [Acidimicrobiales bacterium]|nr:Ig-like domain-containing protein [Acidimicrobiales bacterium]